MTRPCHTRKIQKSCARSQLINTLARVTQNDAGWRYVALPMVLWICGLGSLVMISRAHAEPPPKPKVFIDAPARIDPAQPLKIGPEFYPVESMKLREEGRCVVRVTVDKAGEIHDPQMVTSSGFERLDTACIAATTSGHMLPAIKNGSPIASAVTLPISWTLPKPATLSDCMAIPASAPLASAQPGDAGSKGSKKTNISAKVMLRLFVSETGAIDGVKVDQSSGFARLDEAAVKGVTGQKMIPAMAAGQAMATCVKMPIVFDLKQ